MPLTKKPELNQDEVYIITTLVRLRKWHKLTQSELAERTGLSKALIAQYESFWKKPNKEIVKKIANVLDVNLYKEHLKKFLENKNSETILDQSIYTVPFSSHVAVNYNDLHNICKKKEKLIPLEAEITKVLKNIPNIYAIRMPDNSLVDYELIHKTDYLIIKYLEVNDELVLLSLPDNFIVVLNRQSEYVKKLQRPMFSNSKKIAYFLTDMKYHESEIFTFEKNAKDIKGVVLAVVRNALLPDIQLNIYENQDWLKK